MAGLAATMTRTFLWLGIAASVSLLLALAVMTLVVDAPQIARWFLASAIVAGVSFLAAVITSRWEQ